MNRNYNEKKIDINTILDEVAYTPNGNMRFKTHFQSKDGSVKGWYVID